MTIWVTISLLLYNAYAITMIDVNYKLLIKERLVQPFIITAGSVEYPPWRIWVSPYTWPMLEATETHYWEFLSGTAGKPLAF